MAEITPSEKAILDYVTGQYQPNSKDNKATAALKQRIINDFTAEFEKPGQTSIERIKDIINTDLQDVANGNLDIVGKANTVLDRARNGIGGIRVSGQEVNVAATATKIIGAFKKSPEKQAKELAQNLQLEGLYSFAEDAIKNGKTTEAAVGTSAGTSSVESLIQGADKDKNGVLTATELSNLVKSKDFAALTKGQEVSVDNQPKRDNDALVIGGKSINLGDLGITINDSTAGNATTGFAAGKTTVQKGR